MAYDTHYAIDQFKKGEPDHLQFSLQLFLNFINLLLRIMELMAGGGEKKNQGDENRPGFQETDIDNETDNELSEEQDFIVEGESEAEPDYDDGDDE